MRKSTDGSFPDMGITKSAVDLDSKLNSLALALGSLKYLFDFPMEVLGRQLSNKDWILTERPGLRLR